MIIKGSFYELRKMTDAPFYDLYVPKVVNKGKDTERVDMAAIGYGMPFSSCIRKLVEMKMNDDNNVYTVLEYIERYEELVTELSKDFE